MVVITFAGIALGGVVASLVVERLLRRHLKRVLTDLCETDARSGFWVAIAGLCIVLTGVLAATATFGYTDSQVGGYDLFLGAMTQTRTLLIGLLGIVLVLAMFLLSAVRRFEARTRPRPGAAGWYPPPPAPVPGYPGESAAQ
jgi:di/tricarboxylate transporter